MPCYLYFTRVSTALCEQWKPLLFSFFFNQVGQLTCVCIDQLMNFIVHRCFPHFVVVVVLIGVWVCQRRVWIGLLCYAWHSGVIGKKRKEEEKKKRKNNLDPLVHALSGFSGRIFLEKGDGGVKKYIKKKINRVLPHQRVTED